MNNIIVSLSGNVLKVTYSGEGKLNGASTTLAEEIAQDSRISDIEAFSEALKGLISQVLPPRAKNPILNFLVEPSDAIVEFASVNKTDGEAGEQIVSKIREKLKDSVNLEDVFFSYQKIAPFVYQFVGIKKELVEQYFQISNNVGYSLGSIVPWILLLPQLVNDNQPSIFVFRDNDKQVVVLSELNGVYFTATYESEKSQQELEDLVAQLSVYKRPVPINKIYTVNFGSFTLASNYQVLPLEVPESDGTEGFELHILFGKVLDKSPEVLRTQINFLNVLPLPQTSKKASLVKVGAITLPVLLILGIGLFFVFRNQESPAAATDSNPDVLSETQEAMESSPSETEEEVVLNREDLAFRIENGAGITGLAGQARDFMEGLGYTVLSIGDAQESDRTDTLVRLKPSFVEYKSLIETDMSQEYNLVFEETLDEELEYDALVIVGRD